MASIREKHHLFMFLQRNNLFLETASLLFVFRIQLSANAHVETTVCLTFNLESVTFIANFGYANIHTIEHCTRRLDSHS